MVKHSRNMWRTRWQEIGPASSNADCVEPNTEIARQVARDMDDVLDAVLLLGAVGQPVSRLFDQLTDLLVESLFLTLRAELADGELDRSEFIALAARCQDVGLLPLRRAT